MKHDIIWYIFSTFIHKELLRQVIQQGDEANKIYPICVYNLKGFAYNPFSCMYPLVKKIMN